MIDEFGLGGLTANQRADLLEIINERTREGGKSVIVTSVCPMDVWASCIGDVSCRLVIPFWTGLFIELGA